MSGVEQTRKTRGKPGEYVYVYYEVYVDVEREKNE